MGLETILGVQKRDGHVTSHPIHHGLIIHPDQASGHP